MRMHSHITLHAGEAHKAEHAVDMETRAIVAVTVQAADDGDTTTIVETVAEAGERIAETAEKTNSEEAGERVNPEAPSEIVTDKGYHSKKVVSDLAEAGVRTYCSEPQRGPQRWPSQQREQQAVYANRRRIRGERGKRLLRQRGEKLERWNEHLYDRGGMRRVHLRGRANILKRPVVHAGAANLGLVKRKLLGVGTPRALQSRPGPVFSLITDLKRAMRPPVPSQTSKYGRSLNHSGIHAAASCLPFAA